MKLFLSWSGKRSRAIAAAFNSWLPHVLHAAEPFFSPEMEKGSRWAEEISHQLASSSMGLIFLTQENLEASWLLFEAGALSVRFDESRIYTVLFDLAPSEVPFPLAQFQHTEYRREDILKLVLSMHKHSESPASESVIKRIFEFLWPELDQAIKDLKAQSAEPTLASQEPLPDIATETFALLRDMLSRVAHLETLLQDAMATPTGSYSEILTRKGAEFERRLNELVETVGKG